MLLSPSQPELVLQNSSATQPTCEVKKNLKLPSCILSHAVNHLVAQCCLKLILQRDRTRHDSKSAWIGRRSCWSALPANSVSHFLDTTNNYIFHREDTFCTTAIASGNFGWNVMKRNLKNIKTALPVPILNRQQALSSFGAILDILAFFCSICPRLQEHFHCSHVFFLDGLESAWSSTWNESFGQNLAKS